MIRSPFVDPMHEIGELAVEIGLVVSPCQPVDPRSRVTLQGVERVPESIEVDVVQERGEPPLLMQPCGLPYAVQSLGRALPTLPFGACGPVPRFPWPPPFAPPAPPPVARPCSLVSSLLTAESDFSRSFIMRVGSSSLPHAGRRDAAGRA